MFENAKLRPATQLPGVGFPAQSGVLEEAGRGLRFDCLRSPGIGPRVLTGQAWEFIPLNVEQADDARREPIRRHLHDPCRALLEPCRDTVGHCPGQSYHPGHEAAVCQDLAFSSSLPTLRLGDEPDSGSEFSRDRSPEQELPGEVEMPAAGPSTRSPHANHRIKFLRTAHGVGRWPVLKGGCRNPNEVRSGRGRL